MQRLADLYRESNNLYTQKKYQEGIVLLDQVITNNHGHHDALYLRGMCHLNLDHDNAAMADFNVALQINPNYFYSLEWRAVIFLKRKEYAKAIVDLTKALEINKTPHALSLEVTLANAYFGMNDTKCAIAHCEKIPLTHPIYQHARALRDKIVAYENAVKLHANADYRNAINKINEVISFSSQYEQAYRLRGDCYRNLKMFKESIADFSQWITIDSNHYLAYFFRGLSYLQAKDEAKALVDLSKSISIKPYFGAYYHRGSIYFERKDYQNAINDLNKSHELSPGYAPASSMLRAAVQLHVTSLGNALSAIKTINDYTWKAVESAIKASQNKQLLLTFKLLKSSNNLILNSAIHIAKELAAGKNITAAFEGIVPEIAKLFFKTIVISVAVKQSAIILGNLGSKVFGALLGEILFSDPLNLNEFDDDPSFKITVRNRIDSMDATRYQELMKNHSKAKQQNVTSVVPVTQIIKNPPATISNKNLFADIKVKPSVTTRTPSKNVLPATTAKTRSIVKPVPVKNVLLYENPASSLILWREKEKERSITFQEKIRKDVEERRKQDEKLKKEKEKYLKEKYLKDEEAKRERYRQWAKTCMQPAIKVEKAAMARGERQGTSSYIGMFRRNNSREGLSIKVNHVCGGSPATNPNYNSSYCAQNRAILTKYGIKH